MSTMAPVPPTLQVEETEASQLAVEEGLPAEAPAAAEPAAAEPASAAEVRQIAALTSWCSGSWLACAMPAEEIKQVAEGAHA